MTDVFTTHLLEAAAIAGAISAIVTAAVALVKPLRNKIFGICYIKDGLKCVLRSEMLNMYYRNHEKDSIRQHEKENLESVYKAYKALGGNSFIDSLYREMSQWEMLDGRNERTN